MFVSQILHSNSKIWSQHTSSTDSPILPCWKMLFLCSISVLSLCFQDVSKTIPAKWSSSSASNLIFKNPAYLHTSSCFVWRSPPESEFWLWHSSAPIVDAYWFLWLLLLYPYCFSEMFYKYMSWFPQDVSKPHGIREKAAYFFISLLKPGMMHWK